MLLLRGGQTFLCLAALSVCVPKYDGYESLAFRIFAAYPLKYSLNMKKTSV